MPELTYFDVNARYGARPYKQPQERWSLAHLLDDLDLAGIAAALVRHSQSIHYDAMHGNLRLLREIAPHRDRLHPCWTVLPPLAGDFPGLGDLAARMADEGVRAAAIYPHTFGIPIDESILAPLAESLARHDVLLLVPYPELLDFDRAHRFVTIFGEVQVVLLEASWSQWREVQALMALHRRLHLEFSSFQAHLAVEWFGQRFGFERLLFGTGQTAKSPGAARAFLDYHTGDTEQARMVAGGNLNWLLGGIGPTAPPPPSEYDDALTAAARASRPIDGLVLDAHCHVLHDGANAAGEAYVMPRGDAAGITALQRRLGIAGAAVMSWNGTVGMDATAGNEVTAAAVAQAPERLIGALTLDPTHQSAEEMAAQIETYHTRLGFRGLKPYQRTPLPYNHEAFEPWWRFGEEHRLYGLFHVAVGGVEVVLDIARRHPGLHCLIAHVGMSYAFAEQVVAAMRQAPNLYAELTYTAVTNGIVEWLVEQVGAERVLFGTDAPMRDPRPQLGWVLFTRLTETQKRLILGENFARILADGRLPGHELPAAFRLP